MGWLGVYSYVKHTLRMYGCDFDSHGDPITAVEENGVLRAPGACQGFNFFLGMYNDNNDVAIGNNVRAFKDGKPAGTVAGYLNSTSYGVRNIIVIG